MPATLIIMPTYNEAANLPAIVTELFALPLDNRLEILVVDDNSPDGTGRVADELAARYPGRLHVVHRERKMGLGTAYVTGFRYALAHGADYVVEMDADFSHSPVYLPVLLEKVRDYDVVVGSRYVDGGGVDRRWGPWRRFLSWGGNLYARLVTGLAVHDTTAGFKCFRRQALQGLDLDKIRSDGYAFQIEVAYACQKKGYRLCEVPIFFEERTTGRSKMSGRIVLEAIWRVWDIRRRY
jgi:dolichol-phosphate mannosyltransferase